MKKLLVILSVIALAFVSNVKAVEVPENAYTETTLKKIATNKERYDLTQVLVVGWVRGKLDIEDPRFEFFTLGQGRYDLILILDGEKMGKLPPTAQNMPFVVTGEFIQDLRLHLDGSLITIKYGLLVDSMMVEWDLLN